MSRKMVVAAVAAAGVVGFGSAALASGPLGLGEATESVPGASEVKDRVGGGLAQTQEMDVPGQAELTGAISNLRSQLNGGELNFDPQSADISGDQLAVALEDLAANVREGSGKLSATEAQGAERLAGQLESAADKVQAASLENHIGDAGASGEASAEGAGGSANGGGEMSSDGGAVAGGGSVAPQEAFAQVETALAQAQQMDQQDVLGGSAGDILDRESAEAQFQRIAGQLNGLLG